MPTEPPPGPPEHAVEAYDYPLPPDLVAQEPLAERDASRLLVLERASGRLAHHAFSDLPELLRPGDLLVTNRSRVFPARLLGRREGGGAAEVLLVRRREPTVWDAMVRPGRRLRPGTTVDVADGFRVRVESTPVPGGLRAVRLLLDGLDPDAALERHGHVPLPPYIRRPDVGEDRERYQTVFAREPGSVAAPTAGLHFTPALLDRLRARGVERAEIVLHVGPGTFRPVDVRDVRAHRVDPECLTIPAETAAAVDRARAEGRRVVAVGTTTTRALESALDDGGRVRPGDAETDLVIVPGHRFRAVDALVTNFHLPRSSLLLLASAFAGRERVLAAYAEAVRLRYRFYSYGDAMLVV
ncbi:MAG TPA: tRNA preQ1(34) S-adenosylmethionine ribosyltransferase-isomerase QueA [Vicinamibacteria bacterium]|nr:tRNA preQ1(34) S-adenosylmethionine ribosyltransferase-isomerase QueA [Vicinamibacteria bacterium]